MLEPTADPCIGFNPMQLKDHATISKPTGPVMVCILDGYGYNTEDKYNGIHLAETPVYDRLRKDETRFRSILSKKDPYCSTVLQNRMLDTIKD